MASICYEDFEPKAKYWGIPLHNYFHNHSKFIAPNILALIMLMPMQLLVDHFTLFMGNVMDKHVYSVNIIMRFPLTVQQFLKRR